VFLVTCGGDTTGPSTKPLASVRISPAVDTITAIEATVRLVAVALDADGDTLRGKSFTWTTSDEYIADVQNGLVTARWIGSVRITATSEGKSAQCTIWVIQEVASVTVWMDQEHVYMLEQPVNVWADVLDANGYWVPDAQVMWSSSDESVATMAVDQYGGPIVIAKGDGTATIAATADGTQGSATLQVTAAVQLLWEFQTDGEVSSSPALGTDGTVYVGSWERLYAINPDGTKKWDHLTGGFIFSSPAVGADGTIYVGSGDYRLYAMNPDGTGKWDFMTGGEVFSSPAIASDGTIYVGSNDGRLYAVNPDGTEMWNFLTGGAMHSSPAVGVDGAIYVGSFDGRVYAVNPDGTEKWSYLIGGDVVSSPAIAADGTVYVTSQHDARVHAVNPDGSAKWSYLYGGDPMGSSPVIAPDGTIYVGTGEPEFLAFNPDGTLKWTYTMDYSEMWSAAAVAADGTIYVSFVDWPFTALNADGSLLWEARLSYWTYSSPAIAPDGTLYVGSDQGKVYAVVPVAGAAKVPARCPEYGECGNAVGGQTGTPQLKRAPRAQVENQASSVSRRSGLLCSRQRRRLRPATLNQGQWRRSSVGDCLDAVQLFDGIERTSPADSTDLAAKETIDLTFATLDADRLAIVIGSRQSLLPTFLLYQAFAWLGTSAGHWLATLERGDQVTTDRVASVVRTLGGIEVRVQDEVGRWQSVGEVIETGPLGTDVRLVPILRQSDSIRVQLRMAKGAWRIDYVALAELGDPVTPITLRPETVYVRHRPSSGALEMLLDSSRVLTTFPGDEYVLRYRLPDADSRHELFLESRGYYLEWMRDEWIAEENPMRAAGLFLDPARTLRELAPEFKQIEPSMENAFWNSKYVHP
jgi:outer membrane protein assembly factor BamB